jgi:ribosomal protein S19E (S16A)
MIKKQVYGERQDRRRKKDKKRTKKEVSGVVLHKLEQPGGTEKMVCGLVVKGRERERDEFGGKINK